VWWDWGKAFSSYANSRIECLISSCHALFLNPSSVSEHGNVTLALSQPLHVSQAATEWNYTHFSLPCSVWTQRPVEMSLLVCSVRFKCNIQRWIKKCHLKNLIIFTDVSLHKSSVDVNSHMQLSHLHCTIYNYYSIKYNRKWLQPWLISVLITVVGLRHPHLSACGNCSLTNNFSWYYQPLIYLIVL
jgi:hypothetical protein